MIGVRRRPYTGIAVQWKGDNLDEVKKLFKGSRIQCSQINGELSIENGVRGEHFCEPDFIVYLGGDKFEVLTIAEFKHFYEVTASR